MNTTPIGGTDLSAGVRFQEQPSLTWYADPETHRLQGLTDGLQAAAQAVEVMLSVERFRWQIYGPHFGVSWAGLIGQDPGYVASELQRRIRDALSVDRRVLGIQDFSYSAQGDTLTARFTVQTVYGDLRQTVEVRTQ